MNNYTIAMKVNNLQVTLDNYAHFETMFEVFLEYVENANKVKHPIDDVVMKFKDAIIATDVITIILIGTSVAGFDIMFTDQTTDYFIKSIPLSVLLDSPETILLLGTTVNVNIVGKRQQIYDVLPNPMQVSNISTMLSTWASIVKEVRELEKAVYELPDVDAMLAPVDPDWMLGYYVRNELKQIKELLDTDLTEAKKRIRVMEYMINSKVKI